MVRNLTIAALMALSGAMAANVSTLTCTNGNNVQISSNTAIKGLGPNYTVQVDLGASANKEVFKMAQAKLHWEGYGNTFDLDSKKSKSKPKLVGGSMQWRIYSNFGAATRVSGSIMLRSKNCKGWVTFSNKPAVDLP